MQFYEYERTGAVIIMECEITRNGDIMKASLKGEIDHHSVADVREKIDSEVSIYRPATLFLILPALLSWILRELGL